jgi:hypothetical protein
MNTAKLLFMIQGQAISFSCSKHWHLESFGPYKRFSIPDSTFAVTVNTGAVTNAGTNDH